MTSSSMQFWRKCVLLSFYWVILLGIHDDTIKWKHFPHNWPFVWGIERSQENSPQKGQWCGTLMFSLICAWINGGVNKHEAGDLRLNCTYYDITVMLLMLLQYKNTVVMDEEKIKFPLNLNKNKKLLVIYHTHKFHLVNRYIDGQMN